MSNVDLHIHSTVSDGTDTYKEIIEKLIKNDIKIFSLTDHDNILYSNKIKDMAIDNNLKYITGIEFSCFTTKTCHILGYNFDVENKSIKELINKKNNVQAQKMQARLDYLYTEYKIKFSDEDLKWLFSNNRAGKPHIAQLLVKNKYADTKDDAFNQYLNKFKIKSENISPKEAIDAIKSAGGISIWAHPLGGEGEKHLEKSDFYKEFEKLKICGIDGLECWYSRYNKSEIEFLSSIANDNNFLISGGSDYHGNNKNISLGELNNFKKPVYDNMISICDYLK